MARFQKGNPGRPRGARNKLQADVINAYAEDFAKHGASVLNIIRTESPVDWMRLAVALLPKEMLFEEVSAAADLSDEELEGMIATLRAKQEKRDGPLN